jgi:hypothetical protein
VQLNCVPRCKATIFIQIAKKTARQLKIPQLKGKRRVKARGKRKVGFGFDPTYARSRGVKVVRINLRVKMVLPNGQKVHRKGTVRVRVR